MFSLFAHVAAADSGDIVSLSESITLNISSVQIITGTSVRQLSSICIMKATFCNLQYFCHRYMSVQCYYGNKTHHGHPAFSMWKTCATHSNTNSLLYCTVYYSSTHLITLLLTNSLTRLLSVCLSAPNWWLGSLAARTRMTHVLALILLKLVNFNNVFRVQYVATITRAKN